MIDLAQSGLGASTRYGRKQVSKEGETTLLSGLQGLTTTSLGEPTDSWDALHVTAWVCVDGTWQVVGTADGQPGLCLLPHHGGEIF
jgi:hypothetical protein